MHSGRYGVTDEHKGGNRVEIFTANDSRYVVAYGMHSRDRAYGYDGPELWTVPQAKLPELLDEDLHELLDMCDAVMAEAGLALSEAPKRGSEDVLYDLERDTTVELQDGRTMTLDELDRDRCSQEFVYLHGRIFDPGSGHFRVKAKQTRANGLTLWDFGTGIEHRWAALGAQPTVLGPLLKKLAEDTDTSSEDYVFDKWQPEDATVAEAAPERPADDATLAVKAGWLLSTQGYCRQTDTVIDIYEAGLECQSTLKATMTEFAAWSEPEMGVSGRPLKSRISAFGQWMVSPARLNLAGARMHPGMGFPLYEEDGKRWKNIYRRPVHAGAGDIAPLLRFMERFLPVAEEREWLLDWMAHKQWKPEIPGTCVLFVADETDAEEREGRYGTGRGLLFKVAHQLYGVRYSRAQSFTMLDGSSSQSTFNDWLHGSVLVTVDETKTSPTAHRKGERKSVYEVLKDYVDPSPKGHRFNSKYGRPFDGWSYCSIWLASNHADALAIPRKDRRFTVLSNGREMTPDEVAEFLAWMAAPGNIAALARYLDERDLTAFNMQRPLETAGKAKMAELMLTRVDDVMIELAGDDTRGLVFTRQQLEHAVEDIVSPVDHRGGSNRRRGSSQWHGEFAAAWSVYCESVETEKGSPCRVRIGGRQVRLFCFRKRRYSAKQLNEGRRRLEAGKWGAVDDLKVLLSVLKSDDESQDKDK
jgi:hypothetical protein